MTKPRLHWNGPLIWYDGALPATDKEARLAERILDAIRGGPMRAEHLAAVCDAPITNVVWRMVSSGLVRLDEDWRVARVTDPYAYLRDAGYKIRWEEQQ